QTSDRALHQEHEKGRDLIAPFFVSGAALPQAAVDAFGCCLAAAAAASSRRISDRRFCTSAEKMYCAGRWLSRLISGAIGPVVRTPRSATHSALKGLFSAAVAAVGS